MTALLMHRGVSPSIVGAFSGLCLSLVKKSWNSKGGSCWIDFSSSTVSCAHRLTVYLAGSVSQRTALLIFLASIALSWLGHMSYDVVGTQIVQIGVPA